MKILPAIFYRDPAEVIDQLREMDKYAKRKAEQDRIIKGRRIKALVNQVMKRTIRGDR